MKMPNPGRAVVDIESLCNYCLSSAHPRGRHKARVFAATLGLTADRAGELQEALFAAAQAEGAILTEQDDYGQRYVVDFGMNRPTGQARVRSSRIVRRGEDFARFTSSELLTSRKPGRMSRDPAYPDRRRGRSSDRPALGTRRRAEAARGPGRARADLKVGPYAVLPPRDNRRHRGAPRLSKSPEVAGQITHPLAQRRISHELPTNVRSSEVAMSCREGMWP